MRRLVLLVAACAIISVQAASAADVTTSWTGWYVGVQGGWANGRAAQTSLVSGVSLGYYDQNGGVVGGTAGYNWQVTNWILGLEADLAWANVKGQETNCGLARTGICPTEMRAFGTARLRAGVAVFSNTMVYATGGLAYADIRAYKEASSVTGGDDWRAGWTVGVGVETMILPKWSLKVEYLYATIPGTATTYTIVSNGNPIAAVERDIQMIRAGLNWHF